MKRYHLPLFHISHLLFPHACFWELAAFSRDVLDRSSSLLCCKPSCEPVCLFYWWASRWFPVWGYHQQSCREHSRLCFLLNGSVSAGAHTSVWRSVLENVFHCETMDPPLWTPHLWGPRAQEVPALPAFGISVFHTSIVFAFSFLFLPSPPLALPPETWPLGFWQRCRNNFMKKETSVQQMVFEQHWTSICRKGILAKTLLHIYGMCVFFSNTRGDIYKNCVRNRISGESPKQNERPLSLTLMEHNNKSVLTRMSAPGGKRFLCRCSRLYPQSLE